MNPGWKNNKDGKTEEEEEEILRDVIDEDDTISTCNKCVPD